jgi:hypothetical protein
MQEAYPVAFLPEHHALAIAIMSYNGQMNFGLLGDFDALTDIELIGESIAAELATLVELARGTIRAAESTGNGRGPISAERTKRPSSH